MAVYIFLAEGERGLQLPCSCTWSEEFVCSGKAEAARGESGYGVSLLAIGLKVVEVRLVFTGGMASRCHLLASWTPASVSMR